MKKKKRTITITIITLILIGLIIVFLMNKDKLYYFQRNLNSDSEIVTLKIYSSMDFNSLMDTIIRNDVFKNPETFKKVAIIKEYPENIKGGLYVLKPEMNNRDIVNLLLSGNQTPVKITILPSLNINTFASSVSKQLELDSTTIVNSYNSPETLQFLKISKEEMFSLLLPNTYEFYWNVSIDKFWKRLKKESDVFWNEDRLKKLDDMNFSKLEAITLASIVERESNYKPERPDIAGVYINRLNKRMLLQADPTLVFIAQTQTDTIRRVLNKHKLIESPYNTYIHLGLPPGPIYIPSLNSIDAVLNYNKHNYIFFCADSDMSGKHVFSKTYAQHLRYARKFQNELNKQGIYK